MRAHESSRPLASLLTQIVSEVAYLLQTEIRLAKAEASEKIGQASRGGAMLGVAAVLLVPGLFILLMGVVRWLEVAGIPSEWGFLIVGGLILGIGIGLALKGINNLKGSELVPKRTIEQVRADFTVAKEKVT